MTLDYRISGGVIGLAVGDALGVPVEFKSREEIKLSPVVGMQSGGIHQQTEGTWSDDSSLTFCLMESLCSGFDLHDIAGNFSNWLNNSYWTPHGDVFDRGIATTKAIHRFDNNMSPALCGGMAVGDNGNGSLMRILPIAFYLKDEASIMVRFEHIKAVSSITHMHFRSVFTCFIYVEYLILLIQGQDRVEALKKMQMSVQSFALEMEFNPSEVALFQRVLVGNIKDLKVDEIRSSGYVLHTLEASLWCFLTSENFSESVLKAVNLGDDSDTTGAVTGGLAGSYFGRSAISKDWANKLARSQDVNVLIERFTRAITDLK